MSFALRSKRFRISRLIRVRVSNLYVARADQSSEELERQLAELKAREAVH